MKIPQVMVFTQRPEFKMLLEIECKGFAGFSPIIHHDLDDFKSMLDLFVSIDILIIDGPEDQSLFLGIISEIERKRSQIKEIFFLSKSYVPIDNVIVFAKEGIVNLLSDLKAMINPASENSEEYISIPIDFLNHFKFLPFDLYVKIGDEKFIKRVPAHEEIDGQTFAGFLGRGITDLYFEKSLRRDFSLMLVNSMINKVEREYENIDDKLLATNEVYLTTHQIVARLGFKPKVIEVCESVINQIAEDVSAGKDTFAKFLAQLRTQKELSFNYRLMELTSFIATQMIDGTDDSYKQDKIRTLVFASMFCDYTLTKSSHIHIRKADELLNISAAEQNSIIGHALTSSELVHHYQRAPIEAFEIIKQHHGSVTGVGFPQDISPVLLPLSKCLMAAQEVSYQILMEGHKHPMEILGDVKLKFVGTPLQELMELFENICKLNLNNKKSE